MLFFRIVGAGWNRNGIYRYKVYGYKPLSWKKEQYDYISVENMRALDFGTVYANNHYIMTQWEKSHILERLEKTFGKDNFVYIFE